MDPEEGGALALKKSFGSDCVYRPCGGVGPSPHGRYTHSELFLSARAPPDSALEGGVPPDFRKAPSHCVDSPNWGGVGVRNRRGGGAGPSPEAGEQSSLLVKLLTPRPMGGGKGMEGQTLEKSVKKMEGKSLEKNSSAVVALYQ